MNITLRKISFVGLVICAATVLGAIYIEHNYMLSPCPLCMLQRIAYGLLATIFLIGSIFAFKSALRYVYSLAIFLAATLGFSIASYQFWLQYFAPPQRVSCAASLQRLMELYPILDALQMALRGSPECAKVDFTIMYISVAGWSVVLFGTFMILTLYVIYAQKKRWI